MEGLKGIRIPTKPTNQYCFKHKDRKEGVQMVTTPFTSEPFCPVCAADDLKKQKQEHDRKISEDNTRNFLYEFSLVDSSVGFDKTFENYKAGKASKERNVGKLAFKTAIEYIRTPGDWKKNEDGSIYHGRFNKTQRIHGKPITTLMIGKPGRGKSHLAMAMINKINKESKIPQKCLFLDINMLFDRVISSFKNPDEYWAKTKAIETIASADVVVIDDLGTESSMRKQVTESTEFKQEFLKKIFDCQHRLIITTNLSTSELKQVYNPKVVSRLFANSKSHLIDFNGIDDKRIQL